MAKRQNDLYYIEGHRFRDEKLHASILAEGDAKAAQRVSDEVARDIGLTDAEITALHASKGSASKAAKRAKWRELREEAQRLLAMRPPRPKR